MNLGYLGKHILVEYYNCNINKINDKEFIEKIMKEAAEKSKATIVESVFHLFNPFGISGAVIISESHLSIHTWPEFGFAAVDLFTCGDEVDPWPAFEHLKDMLESQKYEYKVVARGVTEKIENYSETAIKVTDYKAR